MISAGKNLFLSHWKSSNMVMQQIPYLALGLTI